LWLYFKYCEYVFSRWCRIKNFKQTKIYKRITNKLRGLNEKKIM